MKETYLNSERNFALSLTPSKAIRLFLMVFAFCMFGSIASAQTTTVTLATGTTSWTVPCGVTSITVEAWGGGGAGGGTTSNTKKGGGGGAGGSYASKVFSSITSGTTYNCSIGAGATGATTAGGSGTDTWFANNTTVFAQGGGGGVAPNNANVSGGTAATTGNFGDTTSYTVNGTGGSTSTSGAGSAGAGGGGTGGAIGTITGNGGDGNPGTAPGGGGSGAFVGDSSNRKGGAGGAGQIKITYTTPAVIALPTSVTTTATAICNGSSINLNATSAGNTIYWYTVSTGGVSIGNSASGVNFSVSPIINTTYYAEAVAPSGCPSATRTATGLITVTTLAITTQPVTPASYCAGSGTITIGIAAGSGNTYQWRKGGVNLTNTAPYSTVTSSSLTITNATVAENGAVFDVVVTKSGCSITSNPVTFTVNTSPTATISGATGVCIGSTTTLTAVTPGGTWSSSNTARATVNSSTGVVTGVAAGSVTINYSVTVSGCTSSAAKTMTISSSPAPTISFSQGTPAITSQTIGACGQVGGGGQNDLDIVSGDPGGTSTYAWEVSYDNGATWVNGPGPTSTTTQYVLDPFQTTYTSNAGTYKFRAIVNNNGCSGISNVITLTVTGTSALNPGVIAGNQSSCGASINPITFTSTSAASGLGVVTYIYQWQSSINGINFTDIAGATSTTYDSPAITQTTYFRRSVKYGGCSGISNVLSVLVGPPTASVTSQPTCATATGTITVTVPLPMAGITFTVTGTSPITAPVTGNTTGIFSGLASGVYDVVFVTSACTSLATSVTVNAQPLTPTTPVTTVTQPCGIPTGTITVTTQNAGETYSFDNGATFQVGNSKSSLAAGTYNVIIKSTGGCNSTPKSTVVNASPTVPTTPVTAVTHPNCTTATGTITVTVQTVGETYSFDNGVTFQASNIKSGLVAGSYDVVIKSSGGCDSVPTTTTINAQPAVPLAPTVTETAPTCTTPTGTITITQVGVETYSFDGGVFSGTLIYSGLAQGSLHSIIAKNAGGCTSPATNVSITSLTNTWTVAGGWSLGTPTAEQNINFSENYSGAFDVIACSCQVTGTADVTILSGNTLTLTNGLDVASTAVMTFEDSSSLIQNNDVVNTGIITYNRQTTPIVRYDYTYWSSPVQPLTLGDVSKNRTLADKYFSYNSSIENWKQESAATPMVNGIGYIIRAPQSYGIGAPSTFQASFIGVPNNGPATVAVTAANASPGTSWLLGNPYPSAIDADDFINANNTILDGTLYFWSHNTSIQLATNITNGTEGSGIYAYTSDDYASYNLSGGVGTGTDALAILTPIAKDIPTGKIAAGQGFFANAIASGTVNFTNTMRLAGTTILDGTGTNQQFFKTKNPKNKTNTGIEKNRVWLNLSNGEGAFKQTLIGYIEGATNDNEKLFDGYSFDGNKFVDFYSVNQNRNLVIQGRALPFDENDAVPLGYKSSINGNFSINIDHVDGLLTNQDVFIEDKLTATIFNLKNGNYTFNTVTGTFNNRFVLRYVDKTLTTNNFETTTNEVLVSNKNKQIRIDSSVEIIDKVLIYDLLGRQIYQKNNVNSKEFLIANLISSHQTLIVETFLQNGKTNTSKIIY